MSLCGLQIPTRPFSIKRLFDTNKVEEIFLEDHLKLSEDDTVDDVIGKVASYYKLNALGFYIFSLKEPLIYRIKNANFDINPFVMVAEYTGLTYQLEVDETMHTKCLIDFEIPDDELYVVYIDDLMRYAKLYPSVSEDLSRFIKSVLPYYFKQDFIESDLTKSYSYNLYEEKAKVRYNLQKTPLFNELNFGDCVLLEAQILVNENETTPFIDLQKIFNIITLDAALPFVYQRGNTPMETRVKVINGITYLIEDDTILIGWLNSVKGDIETRSNKALLLKLKNYDNNYSNITIYRNGKLEIRCQWSEEKAAGKEDLMLQVERVSKIIEHINKHKYTLPKLNDELSNRKIILPNAVTMMQSFESGTIVGNTRVALCNISGSFTFKEDISFELFNDYLAKNFYSVADVIYKNTKHVFDSTGNPSTYYSKPSSVYLRYKQYSDYGELRHAMTFINSVTANTIGLKSNTASKEKLASIVSKKFTIPLDDSQILVNNIVESFAYSFEPNSTLEYAVNKVVKNPGIEIRLSRVQGAMGRYKYMFIGNISLFYASNITSFLRNVLSSYFTQSEGNLGPIIDIVQQEQEQEIQIDDLLEDIDIDDYLEDYNEEDYLVENVFDDSEYQDGTVPSEAIPIDPNAPSVIPKAKPSSLMKAKSKMSTLDRLRDVNEDLYGAEAKYGTGCQKPFQPAVISMDERAAIVSNISKKIQELGEEDSIKKKHLEYNKKAFESGVNFMNMYYACPSVWCPTCNNFVPFYEIDDGICPTCNQSVHLRKDYNVETGNSSKTYYPVFRTNDLGVMVPCCGVRRYHGWNKVEDGLIKNEDYSVNEGIVETAEQDENYILRKNKLFLSEGRIGHLPDTIAILFEGKNKNCLNERNEVISFLSDEKINCYLRMGVRATRQSFLNAVLLVTPFKTVSEMLSILFDKLTPELFITLKNGSLRYMFRNKENDTPDNALENFKKFIEDKNNIIDERLMWELLSSTGLIMKPINIFIISMNVDDKKLTNPSWLCPLGYDSSKLFSLDRKSLVLIKYDNTYEVLIKSTYEKGRRIKNMLFKENDSLSVYFVNVLDTNCTMEYTNEVMETNGPMTAQEIVGEMNKVSENDYVIDRQILDGYNRIEYLVTRSGLKIPTNLYSGPMLGLPVVSYDSVVPLDYKRTLRLCKKLSELTNIPIAPVNDVIGNNGLVMGIIVQSSNFIETLPYGGSDGLPGGEHSNTREADKALRSETNVDDKRALYIKRKEYEDESYERLRYELSKYLASNEEIRSMVDGVLKSGNLNGIYGVLVTILKDNDLLKLKTMEDNDLVDYKVPTVRKACFSTNEEIKDDIHCYYENGKNKLVMSDERLFYRLANELHKNDIRRDEIMENNVNDIATGIMGAQNDNERIYENLQVSKIQKIIKELFLSDDPMEHALEGLYDVKNPAVGSKYIRKPFVYKFDKQTKLRVPPAVKEKEIEQEIEEVVLEEEPPVPVVENKEKLTFKPSEKSKISFKPKVSGDIKKPVIPVVENKKKINFKPKISTTDDTQPTLPSPIDPTPVVQEEPEPEPTHVVQEEPEPTHVVQEEPEPTPVVEEEPEPEPTPVVQEEPEPKPTPVIEPKPVFKPVFKSKVVPAAPVAPVAPDASSVAAVASDASSVAAVASVPVVSAKNKKITFKTKSDILKNKKITFRPKDKMPSPFS
jgi:hypothetical protein